MERITKIFNHPVYQACLAQIGELEKDRIYCGHDLTHFLDVARIAAILNAEECHAVPKELIYGTALLHDIGRHRQYLHQEPHHEASAKIAKEILKDCDFTKEEQMRILDAILAHRNPNQKVDALSDIIYRADKLSRLCCCCDVEASCNWSREKKNLTIRY